MVQADRAYDVSSSASAGARMDAALWNAASMDEDDKRMCATRLMVSDSASVSELQLCEDGVVAMASARCHTSSTPSTWPSESLHTS